jgi:hypothetical protein
MRHNAGMTTAEVRHMAALLGVPLFSTDLFMPDYTPGTTGRWRMQSGGFVLDHGYHSGTCATFGMHVLLRNRDDNEHTWDTWMSLSPHEIESQELGCRHAYGHTAVMGLGMGWAALNIALRPQVRRVSVIERDPEVIALFTRSGALASVPAEAAAKIHIVQADAMAWRPDTPVDFVHADIWRTLAEPQALDDVRRMQANVQAACIYFWGQELLIHELAAQSAQEGSDPDRWAEAVRLCIAERIALPLLSPAGLDYPAFIAHVAAQRRARWPQGIPDVGMRAMQRHPGNC